MPSVGYGTGAYKRTNGNLPELTLINVFVESAKTSEREIALMSRPGLGVLATNGAGPINGMFSKQGTFTGDVFSISNTTLYRGITSLGTLTGTGPASFAGAASELVVTRGGAPKSYNGTNFNTIAFPDTANVAAVDYIGSLFVFVRKDTQKFYWSAPLDGRTVDALDFASAEREPDALLDVKALGDNIWLFGQGSVEPWSHTGDADLPFTRLEQVSFDKGIYATGCAVKADNTIYFVGSDARVYRIGEVPERVSNHSIEERILASTTVKIFTFQHEGHEFINVRLDTETLALNIATGEWNEWQTYEVANWIACDAVMVGRIAYFGHSTTGQIMGWDEWDDLGVVMERRFTAAQQLDQPFAIDNLRIWANTGQTPLLAGQGSDPVIEMRTSDDAGNTWGDWESESLGIAGDYRTVPEWRCLGLFDFPGVMIEFRVTDPVPLRISAVKINEPGGGRSR